MPQSENYIGFWDSEALNGFALTKEENEEAEYINQRRKRRSGVH